MSFPTSIPTIEQRANFNAFFISNIFTNFDSYCKSNFDALFVSNIFTNCNSYWWSNFDNNYLL
jgi:hypothetical protein